MCSGAGAWPSRVQAGRALIAGVLSGALSVGNAWRPISYTKAQPSRGSEDLRDCVSLGGMGGLTAWRRPRWPQLDSLYWTRVIAAVALVAVGTVAMWLATWSRLRCLSTLASVLTPLRAVRMAEAGE
jgi:hypothetical protein